MAHCGSDSVAFITYTKGAVQYVTSPVHETAFLNWLAKVDNTSSYTRDTLGRVAVKCCPVVVHAVEKKEPATVLKLVKD
jgi:hypothetical protein